MTFEEEVLSLKDGERWKYNNKEDYHSAEIWLKHGVYFLFEMSEFGGKPIYQAHTLYKANVSDLIDTIETWT